MVKSPPANAGDTRDMISIPGLGKTHWRRKWEPTPVFLLRKTSWTGEPAGLQFIGSQSWI